MPKSSTASGAVGKGLADLMKKTKKGRLKLKGGITKKTKRKKKKRKNIDEGVAGDAKKLPLTESRAREMMKLGQDNLRKLMATASVPSAKEYMYVGDRYTARGSASDLLNQRSKKKSDHWCK